MKKLIYPTLRAKAALALLENPKGVSGMILNVNYQMNSGRNTIADFIRLDGISITKESNATQRGRCFFNYSIPNKAEAVKVINILNYERKKCLLEPLTEAESNHYLRQFKD